jgi:hypothetical protein
VIFRFARLGVLRRSRMWREFTDDASNQVSTSGVGKKLNIRSYKQTSAPLCTVQRQFFGTIEVITPTSILRNWILSYKYLKLDDSGTESAPDQTLSCNPQLFQCVLLEPKHPVEAQSPTSSHTRAGLRKFHQVIWTTAFVVDKRPLVTDHGALPRAAEESC